MLTEFFIVVFLVRQADFIFTGRNQCPEELSPVDEIQGNIQLPRWPQTFSLAEVQSDPLCLSEDFHVIGRECSGTWFPIFAPKCSYTSPRKSKLYCPPGYTVVESKSDHVCVRVSRKPWSNTCTFSPKAVDGADDELLLAILKHLQDRGIQSAWLPIKRLDNFGPLLWTIPGPMWGERFDISDEFVEVTYGNKNKRCLVLDLSKDFQVRAETCEADYPYLCIVEKDHFVQGACSPKYFVSPIPGDKRCFSLADSDESIDWQKAKAMCQTAQIDSPLIEQMLSGLGRKNGLEETDLCWIGGNRRYASHTMAMSVAGEVTNLNTTMSLHCAFCQMDLPSHPVPDINLRFYENERQLLLSVYGENGLWKISSSDPGIRCFTNAHGDLIRNVEIKKIWDKRWTAKDIEPDIDFEDRVDLDVDIHKTIYQLKISERGRGYYVCEAHTITGELLSTKPVIAYTKLEGNTFALGLEIASLCQNLEKCDPLYLKIYRRLTKDLEKITSEYLVKDIRLMEILNIETDGNVTVLFHVTAEEFDDEKFGPDSVEKDFMKLKRLFQFLAAINPKEYRFIFLRSCDGCLKSTTEKGEGKLDWPYTFVGITAVSEEICLDDTGLPVYRLCKGTYLKGGAWSQPSGECVSDILPSTRKLYEISKIIQDPTKVYNRELANEVLSVIKNTEKLTSANIYFLSKIIEYEARTYGKNEVLIDDVSRISLIIDKVMETDVKVLKQSRILNSTNILLDSLGILLDFASMNVSTEYLSERDGLISIITPNLIIYISDPNVTEITGLALIKNSTSPRVESGTFLDYKIEPLSADYTIEHVAGLGDIEVATWLPRNMLDVILMQNNTNFNNSFENSTENDPRIVIVLFYNDIVFTSELEGQNNNEVNSRVVSVSVPGYSNNLPFPIPLLFKTLKGASQETKTCAFWDFDYVKISTVASFSAWSQDGCRNSGRTRDLSGELNICLCSHLTHFAQLVLGHFPDTQIDNPSSIIHGEALEVITVIGCILSMVGVFGILITAVVFKTWRKKPGSKVLIQLALALGLEKFTIGILPIVNSTTNPIPCLVTGVVLHYSVLTEFSWMLITAWLQFRRYVTVLGATRPPRFLLKAATFAWGVPLVIVSIVVGVDYQVYLPEIGSGRNFCQVSGIAQYVGLLGPVVIVICLNIFLFLRVIHSILKTHKKESHLGNDRSLVIAQLRLSIMLFFLLGITWIFGLVAKMGGGFIFSYLFCITAALQGFVLFLFFIICDPATRNLWNSVIKLKSKTSSRVSPSASASSKLSEYSQRY